MFADLIGQLADDRPNWIIGILRLQRQEKPNELLVMLDELERLRPRPDFLGDAIQLVVKDIAQPFREDQRQDILLVLRRILCTANRTRRIPDPGFERLIVVTVVRHRLGTSLNESQCP